MAKRPAPKRKRCPDCGSLNSCHDGEPRREDRSWQCQDCGFTWPEVRGRD